MMDQVSEDPFEDAQLRIDSLRALAVLPTAFESDIATRDELHAKLDAAEYALAEGSLELARERIEFVMRAITPREQWAKWGWK